MYYYVIIYGIYNINHYLNRYRCILMVQVPTSGGFYYGLEVAKSPCYPQKNMLCLGCTEHVGTQ